MDTRSSTRLWRSEALILAVCAAILSCAWLTPAAADGLRGAWVSPYGISRHYDVDTPDVDPHESHPGLVVGLESARYTLEAGAFRNSDALTTTYVAATRRWQVLSIGPASLHLHAGLGVQRADYIVRDHTGLLPVAYPALRVGRVEFATLIVPPGWGIKDYAGDDIGVVYTQIRIRLH